MGIEKEEKNIIKKIDQLVKWIRNQVNDAGKKGVVFGLSGGIDSAVVAILCQRALQNNILALILSCESNDSDFQDAAHLIRKFNIPYRNIDITPVYRQLLTIIGMEDKKNKLAKANIKPRLRMIVLYYFANILDYLVVGTGNKSEIAIGYFTKYGDGGVDILPLGNTLKSEVRIMARYLGIPERIITKPPSAGLWQNQTDEEEMGFSYKQLDSYLANGSLEVEKLKKKIKRMNDLSTHKRKTPPIPEF